MSNQEREKWEVLSSLDKARYKVDMGLYHQQLMLKAPSILQAPVSERRNCFDPSAPERPSAKFGAEVEPKAPRRPKSALLCYSDEKRRAVQHANPWLGYAEVSMLLTKMWKEAPASERQRYLYRSAVERNLYKARTAKVPRSKFAAARKISLDIADDQATGAGVSLAADHSSINNIFQLSNEGLTNEAVGAHPYSTSFDDLKAGSCTTHDVFERRREKQWQNTVPPYTPTVMNHLPSYPLNACFWNQDFVASYLYNRDNYKTPAFVPEAQERSEEQLRYTFPLLLKKAMQEHWRDTIPLLPPPSVWHRPSYPIDANFRPETHVAPFPSAGGNSTEERQRSEEQVRDTIMVLADAAIDEERLRSTIPVMSHTSEKRSLPRPPGAPRPTLSRYHPNQDEYLSVIDAVLTSTAADDGTDL